MKPRTSSFIFIMLLVAVIALTIGSPVLLSAAICMLVMLVLALASVVTALLTLQARVVCAATRLLRGEKAAYQAEVSFRSILPVGDIVVNVAGGAGTDSIRFGGMPFRVYRASGEKVFQHRVVYAPVSGSVWVTDVFDLFTFRRTLFAAGGEVTVLPRRRPLLPFQMQMGDTGPEEVRRFPDDASSPSGVREWRDGDLIKRIHWKLTMKTYDPSMRNLKPMVRTYDEAARPDMLVMPDLARLDAVAERARTIEDALCEATLSVIAAQLEEDAPVRLLLGRAGEIEGQGAQDVGAFAGALARVAFDAETPYEQALADATRRLDRTGAIVLITSRLTSRLADCAIRLRQMSGVAVAVIWITDTGRADADALMARLELADVIARRDNPFRAGEGAEVQ